MTQHPARDMRQVQSRLARKQRRHTLLLGVPAAFALSSMAFCGPSRHTAGVQSLLDQAGLSRSQQQSLLEAQALPKEQDLSAKSTGVTKNSDKAVVLLLYPDSGSPGYAEVPHMGTALTGGSPSWAEAAEQLARRVRWDLGSEPVEFRVMSLSELCQANAESLRVDFVFGVDLSAEPPQDCLDMVGAIVGNASSRLFISSSKERTSHSFWTSMTSLSGAGEKELADPGFLGFLPIGKNTEAAKLRNDVIDLWQRRTAEEAVYAMLVLIDTAVTPLPAMVAQRPVPTADTVFRAVDRCQEQFQNCFTQPRCLQSLACLSQCGLADQSCSYRCIVSYQSQAFTDFSLCALQKQNMLNSQIERPPTPQARPLDTFRGSAMTHETAESILVGHFNPENHRHSWLVAAGSNPAYEQFALQYQLWYKGSAKNTFWYHPTFLVEALDGAKIWRTRDYRVRRRDTPGMWDFSVVDNGIISEERWHLLGADDDLQWIVLFYVGVARRAGLSYRGCLVLTPEGDMPGPEHSEAISAAIARADMKPWELEATSNPPVDPSNPPPLIAPETQEAAPLLVPAAA
mmetsp:Transcript_2780/g.4731  ORF Transcript_2780/g.4731 Transcript_2780/m.4731 type:complete len:571 (+) Transcript_2780:25-1737(+)